MNDLFEKILFLALNKHASDIHILVKEKCEIYYRIKNSLSLFETYPPEIGNKLINFIKFQANIDVNFRLKPQTGRLTYLYKQTTYALRISSLPTSKQESIVLRILNQSIERPMTQLYNDPRITTFLQRIITMKSGLFLVSGATGSGKSTTIYSLLDEIAKQQNKNIITMEDPVELQKDYAQQIEINEEMGITYQSTLHQVLRHDPDIIVIGEIRDIQTAKMAITCALTGHLVISTIHASFAKTTLQRLINMGISSFDLQETICGVINQLLFYRTSSHAPLVVAEYLTKLEVVKYLNREVISYYDYSTAIKYLVHNDYISNNSKEDLFHELGLY